MQPKFTLDGKIKPFQPGDVLHGYTIEAHREWLGKSYYLVRSKEQSGVLLEGPAHFRLPWQQKIWQNVTPVMSQFGLLLPQDWFQADYQNMVLNYTLFPEALWQQLDCSLQEQLWQAGLFPEHLIRQAYQWMTAVQKSLAAVGWTNPSLVLPLLTWQPEIMAWGALEWENCVPLNDELQYPCFYAGYHHAITLFAVKKDNINQRHAHSAVYASLQAMLQGKQPYLWAPEAISHQAISGFLSQIMREWLQRWPQATAPGWPALPEGPIYRRDAKLEPYKQACLLFNQATDCLQDQVPEQAYSLFLQAHELYQNDPWTGLMLARLLRGTESREAIQDLLDNALRVVPLAIFYLEKATLALEAEDIGQAREAVAKALQRCPHYDEAWYLQGVIAHQSQNLKQAEQSFRKACNLRPLNTRYRQALSSVLDILGLTTEAEQVRKFSAASHAQLSLRFSGEAEEIGQEALPQPTQVGDYSIENWYAPTETSYMSGQTALGKAPDGSQIRLQVFDLRKKLQSDKYTFLKHLLPHLRHQHLLPFYGAREQDSQGFLAFPYLPVPSLETQLKQQFILEPETILLLSMQLESTLQFLQEQEPPLAHGDIKPANILWHPQHQHALLIDFESLGLIDQKVSHAVFTDTYAPREIRSQNTPSHVSDAYSLSLTLLHLATGLFPQLCASWKTHDFSKYRRYLNHMPTEWVETLLTWSRWEPERRKIQALPKDLISQPIPQKQREMAELVMRLSMCEAESEVEALANSLIQIEASSVTFLHAAFHFGRLGHFQAALQYARKCLQGDPSMLPAFWIQAEAYDRLHKPDMALKTLEKALKLDSDQPETYRHLVRIHTEKGQFELAWAAVQHLERCLPDQLEVQMQRLRLLVYLKMDYQAMALAKKLSERNLPGVYQSELANQITRLHERRQLKSQQVN